jgi:putative DNA primase/helicase
VAHSTKDHQVSVIDPLMMKRYNRTISGLRQGSASKVLQFMADSFETFEEVKHPGALAAKNGMISLNPLSFRPFTLGDNVTMTLGVDYNPDADAGPFDQFVRNLLCEPEYQYFRHSIGYAVQGNPDHKMMFILYGKYGNNGKSLLMNSICNVLGPVYAEAMGVNTFAKKRQGKPTPELMAIKGKRIGYIGDVGKNMNIDAGMFKRLVGGTDKVSGRKLYGSQEIFKPVMAPFLNSNDFVVMDLTDPALRRRVTLIPFEFSFVDNPTKVYERLDDKSLCSIFETTAGKEGILKWIVDSSTGYHNNAKGFQPTPKMEDYMGRYIKEMDADIMSE